jgi:hypothetical protein
LAINDHARARAIVLNVAKPTKRTVVADCPNIHSFALSPDGRLLAVGQSLAIGEDAPLKEVGVWETSGGRVVQRLPRSQDHPGNGSVSFSPDGRWLAVGGRSDYRCYSVPSWKGGPVFPRERLEMTAGPVAFSADSRLLAVAHTLQSPRLFDLATRQEIATLVAPDAHVIIRLCFSPDGSQLAAVAQNHVIQLWDLAALGRQLRDLGLDCDLATFPTAGPARSDRPRVAVVHDTIEAEYFPVVAAADCNYVIQDMDQWGRQHWSNGHQLLCYCRKGGFVEFEVGVLRAGVYTLEVRLSRAPDYGVVEVSLDGKPVGKVFDGFQDRVAAPSRVALGAVRLEAGDHRLRFTVVGRNPQATNYYLGIDCLAVTPAKESGPGHLE